MNLKGRHFLTLKDFTKEEILYMIDLAAELKDKKKRGIPVDTLKGKNVALIFEKTSTRTRCSFEVAAHDLGMGTTYLEPDSSQIGKKESIKDTARVLGRMFDGIEYRGYGQEIVEELAKYAGVPVWNGLTNEYHPTQMLADMLTIREHFGKLEGLTLVYMGDARYNMGNSLMIACAKLGLNFTACTSKKYFPDEKLVEECRGFAKESGAVITLTEDVEAGTKGADVVYTDVWVSMGEPDEIWEERIRELSPYKVTGEVMKNAGEQSIFLHCLPAFHDLETKIGKEMGERFNLTEMEVTDEVFESEQSKVFDEAENRMHTIKAVMAATLGGIRHRSSPMFLNEIMEQLQTKTLGRKLVWHKKLESTNTFLKDNAEQYPDGTVVIADYQTAGKGSKGRKWESPKGTAVFMSLLLRPDLQPYKAPKLTLVMAVSMVRALNNLGVEARIKWPNDIVINGKKLAGILTEMSADKNQIKYVVLGIGINVLNESFPGELQDRATSLWMETRKKFAREKIVAEVMNCFEQDYGYFVKNGELLELLEQYRQFSATLGKEVRVIGINTEYQGLAADLTEDGCLIVEKTNGERAAVLSDEVSVRGIYGYV